MGDLLIAESVARAERAAVRAEAATSIQTGEELPQIVRELSNCILHLERRLVTLEEAVA